MALGEVGGVGGVGDESGRRTGERRAKAREVLKG